MGVLGVVALMVLLAVGIGALTSDDGNPGSKGSGKKAGGSWQKPGGKGAQQGGKDGSGASSEGSGPDGPVLPESRCPSDLDNCVVASGKVIYVEAVDPDGDGDAHFVTLSEENVTGAGMTVFDVRTDLRPDPLPEVGDTVGGAGPVYRGSHGQKQIEVIEFHVAR